MGRLRVSAYFRLAAGLAFFAAAGVRATPPTGASTAPFYSAASIAQAAANISEPLAPNTIASMYGTNLSYDTHAITPADLHNGSLPTSLAGVTVYVNNLPANLIYVSPAQINFLVPYEITTLSATVYVLRDGVAGPVVTIQLTQTAPAFFQWSGNFAVAEHADGSVISPDAPAQPGEVVVLYAAGLGRTSPDLTAGRVPESAATIFYASQLEILLNGVPCPPESVLYAGVTPGYAGLYQINLLLPPILPANPEIQIVIGSQSSPAAVQLAAE
jgi:uncharacterized protein (TIGR03437 family)